MRQTGRLTVNIQHAALALFRDESGQNLVEYALVAGLVALGAVLVLSAFSNQVSSVFNSIGNTLAGS